MITDSIQKKGLKALSLLLTLLLISGLLPNSLFKPLQVNAATTHNINSSSLVIKAGSGDFYITGGSSTSNTINIEKGYNGTITLDNVTIVSNNASKAPIRVHGDGSLNTAWTAENNSNKNPVTKVKIVLKGENSLSFSVNSCLAAALQVDQGAQIELSAIDPDDNNSGKLTAVSRHSKDGAAGIGGSNVNSTAGDAAPTGYFVGNYMYQGTTVQSSTDGSPASNGVGPKSERRVSGGNIIISSGTIHAQGGRCGAGIGGGGWGALYLGTIVITGGVVSSVGGEHSPGIGSGCVDGRANNGSYAPGTNVVALPPADISATTPKGKGLSGAQDIVYIGDSESPAIKIRTTGYEKEADIYVDLSEEPIISGAFKQLGIKADLSKVYFGKTASTSGTACFGPNKNLEPIAYSAGELAFRATLKNAVTFFTDASSTATATYGRPFNPVKVAVTSDKDIELPLFDIKLSLTPTKSIPLEAGYSSADALKNAQKILVEYSDTKPLSNVDFEIQENGDGSIHFPEIKYYNAEGTSTISKPTTLSNGTKFLMVVPIDNAKPIGVYNQVVRFKGIYDSRGTGYIRQVVEQRVVYDDTNTNKYIKVTASPMSFDAQTNNKSVQLNLNINHSGLSSLYNPSDVVAKYLITTEPNYERALASSPLNTWSNLSIPATDGANKSTSVSFAGKPDDTYYIHWYVTSGVVYGHSKDHVDPAATYGAFGEYSIDSVAPVATLEIDNKTTDCDIATPKNKLPVKVTFSEDVTFDASKISVTNGNLDTFTKVNDHEWTSFITPKSGLKNNEIITVKEAAGAGKDKVNNISVALPDRKITLKANQSPIVNINNASTYNVVRPSFEIELESGDYTVNDNKDLSKSATFSPIANNADLKDIFTITSTNGGTVPSYTVKYQNASGSETKAKAVVTFSADLTNNKTYKIELGANKLYNLLGNANTAKSATFEIKGPDFTTDPNAGISIDPIYFDSNGGNAAITVKGSNLAVNNGSIQVRVTSSTGFASSGSYKGDWISPTFVSGSPDSFKITGVVIPANTGSTSVEHTYTLEYRIGASGSTEQSGKICKTYVDPANEKILSVTSSGTTPDLTFGYLASAVPKQTVTIKNNSARAVTDLSLSLDGTNKLDFRVVGLNPSTIPTSLNAGQQITVSVFLNQGKNAGTYTVGNIKATGNIANASPSSVSGQTALLSQKVTQKAGGSGQESVTGNPAPNDTAKYVVNLQNKSVQLTPSSSAGDTIINWEYSANTGTPGSYKTIAGNATDTYTFAEGLETTYYIDWKMTTNNYSGVSGRVKSGANTKYIVDTKAPTVTSITPSVTTIGGGNFTTEVVFSENLKSSLSSADVILTNASIDGAIQKLADNKYKFTVKPDGNGDISIKLQGGSLSNIKDIADNHLLADSSAVTVTYNATAPTVQYKNDSIYNESAVSAIKFDVLIKANDPAGGTDINIYKDNTGINKYTDGSSFESFKISPNVSFTQTFKYNASGDHVVEISIPTAGLTDKQTYTLSVPASKIYNKSGNPNVVSQTTFKYATADFSDSSAGISAQPVVFASTGGNTTVTIKGKGLAEAAAAGKLALKIKGDNGYESPDITALTQNSGFDTTSISGISIPANTSNTVKTYTFTLYKIISGSEISTAKTCQVYVNPQAQHMLAVNVTGSPANLTFGYDMNAAKAQRQKVSVTNNSAETITISGSTIPSDFAVDGSIPASMAAGATNDFYIYLNTGKPAGSYGSGQSVVINAKTAITKEDFSGTKAISAQTVVAAAGSGGEASVIGNPEPHDSNYNVNTSATIVRLTPKATNSNDSVKSWKYAVSTSSTRPADNDSSWVTISDSSAANYTVGSGLDSTYYIHWIVNTNNYNTVKGTVTSGTSKKYLVDTISPTASFNSLPSSAGLNNFSFDLVFSESIYDFTKDDLQLTNASIVGTPTSADGNKTFSITVKPNGGGDIKIELKANSTWDKAGNKCSGISGGAAPTIPYTSDRPVTSFSFTQNQKFLENQSDLTITIKAQGKSNQNLRFSSGNPLSGLTPANLSTIIKVERDSSDITSSISGAAFTADSQGGKITISGTFTDGNYTVTVLENSVLNDTGNGIVKSIGNFEIRNVAITPPPGQSYAFDVSPSSLTYSGGTVTVSIYGTNLQHANPGDLVISSTSTIDGGSPVARPDTTQLSFSADGTKATYTEVLPANAANKTVTYKYKGSYKSATVAPVNNDQTVVAAATPVIPPGTTPGDGTFLKVDPSTHESTGGTSVATIKGENIHNFDNLRLEITTAGTTVPVITAPTPGNQTVNQNISFANNDTAVDRIDKVELVYMQSGTRTLLDYVNVTVKPSVPEIKDFSFEVVNGTEVSGASIIGQKLKEVYLDNQGGIIDFVAEGVNLHNFAPMAIESDKVLIKRGPATIGSQKLDAKQRVVVPENTTPQDIEHIVTLFFTDQTANLGVDYDLTYAHTVKVIVQGSYPTVASLTLEPSKFDSAGGTINTAKISGNYLNNFTSVEIYDHTQGVSHTVTPTDISADGKTAIINNIALPAWNPNNPRNDIYLFEVKTEGNLTGITSEAEVGDSKPNITGVTADPNEYPNVPSAEKTKGASQITIHGNYLFNYPNLQIYDPLYEKSYAVSNKGDQTATYTVNVPTAEGVYEYHVYEDGEFTGFKVEIGVGYTPGGPVTPPNPEDGPEEPYNENKHWTATGGGSKGRAFTGRNFVGFEVLAYQCEQTAKNNPKKPTVIVSDLYFITKAQIDMASTNGHNGARASEKLGNGDITLIFDTLNLKDDSILDGRLTVDISKPVPDLYPGVFTAEEEVKDTLKLVEDQFPNNKIAIVSLGQNGSYASEVKVSAFVDLEDFNEKTLHLYLLDRKTNEYRKMVDTKHLVDTAGFLHFYTKAGGEVIITDTPLPKESGTIK